jgi:hypothetical protein
VDSVFFVGLSVGGNLTTVSLRTHTHIYTQTEFSRNAR